MSEPVLTKEQMELVAAYQRQIHAAQRLLKLKRAREDLLDFTTMSMPDPNDIDNPEASRYRTHAVHRYLADLLAKVERGEVLRLIVSVQPRVGKSELVSKRFPAWFVGRDPYRQVIVTSYAESLATDFGREVREVMKSPFYQQVFPGVELRKGNASADRLQTSRGGVLTFAGAGGGLTGKGADLLVIDDPYKGHEDANSRAQRDKLWNWFTTVALSRVMGKAGRVVLCMTRWHEDDLVGRLTNPKNPYYNPDEAAKWTVVNIPAFAEDGDVLGRTPGELLWPERTPLEFLESFRRLDPAGFAALYMGRPAPPDGNFFKHEHLRTYQPHELPRNLRIYAASDHAVSLEQGRDPSCLGCVGVDENDNIWVLPDLVWRQMDAETQVEAMLQQMHEHRPLFWWAEKGHISKAIGPFLRKRMLEEQVFAAIVEMTPAKDKQTRAQSIQARMAMGKVRFPAFAPWWADARDEMMNFPYGAHDDFVDWLAWIGIGLSQQVAASNPVSRKRAPESGSIQWILQSADRIKRGRTEGNVRYLA